MHKQIASFFMKAQRVMNEPQKYPLYLSIATHHHLFASKHDISGPLQAIDKSQLIM